MIIPTLSMCNFTQFAGNFLIAFPHSFSQGAAMESPREKINRLATEQGKSLNSLSKKVGKASAYLSQYIGLKRSPKVLPEKVRHDLAILLGIDESELREPGAPQSQQMPDINTPQLTLQTTNFSVPVVGAVQAGHWFSMDVVDEIKEAGLMVPGDPTYREFEQYAVKIVGDSINNFAKDGEYAVCVDIHAGIDAEDGDYVVVEALRNGGAEVETTIKRLKITAKGPELWPDSTNPKHKGPIFLGKNGDEVRIKALVLRLIGRARPRRPKALKL